jgi:hypothetical protein
MMSRLMKAPNRLIKNLNERTPGISNPSSLKIALIQWGSDELFVLKAKIMTISHAVGLELNEQILMA